MWTSGLTRSTLMTRGHATRSHSENAGLEMISSQPTVRQFTNNIVGVIMLDTMSNSITITHS